MNQHTTNLLATMPGYLIHARIPQTNSPDENNGTTNRPQRPRADRHRQEAEEENQDKEATGLDRSCEDHLLHAYRLGRRIDALVLLGNCGALSLCHLFVHERVSGMAPALGVAVPGVRGVLYPDNSALFVLLEKNGEVLF